MKKEFFYSVLSYDPKKITEKKLFIFLGSLYKTKDIKIFFVFLPPGGLGFLKKIKEYQKKQGLKFGEQPVISLKKERFLVEVDDENNLSFLCLVAKSANDKYFEIFDKIAKEKNNFSSAVSKVVFLSKIDLITPLNTRGDQDVLDFSFLLSKWAVKGRALKEKICPPGFPLVFFSFLVIRDLFVLFGYKNCFVAEVNYYYQYLLKYFRFSLFEKIVIRKKAKKYLPVFNKMLDNRFAFQVSSKYNNFIDSLFTTLQKEKDLLCRLNCKIGKKKMNGMFFHWFNNSLGINFSQEIAVLFIFKRWYEEKNK